MGMKEAIAKARTPRIDTATGKNLDAVPEVVSLREAIAEKCEAEGRGMTAAEIVALDDEVVPINETAEETASRDCLGCWGKSVHHTCEGIAAPPEPRRWPCSPAAKRLAVYAVNACNREIQDARVAQQESAKIAWELDGLPVDEIEAGTFQGAALNGDEWVELMPEDIGQ